MNGVHDMGGMDGFGPVVREPDEPVFHADWERRVSALARTALRGASNVDEFRHAIERMPPAEYLASSYYERWLAALETLLIEHHILTRDEIEAKLEGSGAKTAVAEPAARLTPDGDGRRKPRRARFKPGDIVRARNLNPRGHTRLPRYVRGRQGIVRRDWGVFTFPDTHAHHAGRRPQHCYSVEYAASELWGASASRRERLLIDLWEDYLEPAAPRPRRNASKGTRR